MSAGLPPLWPRPRQWQSLPEMIADPARLPPARATEKASLLPNNYELRYKSDVVQIDYADVTARRHAEATLGQLRALPGPVPAGVINDGPDYPLRGVMLDISRDQVPTMASLRALVRGIAALKGNHLQLYIEHTVAYPGHEAVWGAASPLDLEELSALAEYAAGLGVEVAANQNTFGHVERWLQHPAYAELGELCDVAARLAAGKPGPFSFCPADERARDLARSWLRQQMAVLPSPWVHIGCDETLDVGQGRSHSAVAQRGLGPVWAEYTEAMCCAVLQAGRRPLFWADMALAHPAALDTLSPEAVAVAWHYEADAPFARWATALGERGRDWWVAPGASGWRSWLGRGDARSGSIAAAATQGLAAGASGLLVTEWGDLGHRQPWSVSWFGLAEGLGAAWNAAAAEKPDYRALARQALGQAELGPWLDRLSRVEVAARQQATHPLRGGPLINANLPFVDTLLPWAQRDWLSDPALWQGLAEDYRVLGAPPSEVSAAAAVDEIRYAARACELACRRAVSRRSGGDPGALSRQWRALAEEWQGLWQARSRPGGLSDSLAHYYKLAEEQP